MYFALWLIAVVLVVAGIVTAIRGQILYGIVLIIIGLLIGPGGVSIFHVHRHHHHNQRHGRRRTSLAHVTQQL